MINSQQSKNNLPYSPVVILPVCSPPSAPLLLRNHPAPGPPQIWTAEGNR